LKPNFLVIIVAGIVLLVLLVNRADSKPSSRRENYSDNNSFNRVLSSPIEMFQGANHSDYNSDYNSDSSSSTGSITSDNDSNNTCSWNYSTNDSTDSYSNDSTDSYSNACDSGSYDSGSYDSGSSSDSF
jgi:hypothetical protein